MIGGIQRSGGNRFSLRIMRRRLVRAAARSSSISAPGASWTGPPRSSTRRRRGRKGGIADRAEPGRSRQEGQQTARAVRCPGNPARRRRVRREHPRQPRPQAAHPRHIRHPLPARAASAPTGRAPRGRGVLLRRPPRLAARTRPHPDASPARGSSRAHGWAGTVGRSNGRSPGCSATATSPSGTSARARASSPSSASQSPRPATRSQRNSPRETRFNTPVRFRVLSCWLSLFGYGRDI